MKKITVLICLFPIVLFAQADKKKLLKKGVDVSKNVPTGLQVGEQAPIINAFGLDGEQINSTKILQEKSIVLMFYRGKWCPHCNRFLSNLSDSLKYITAKNAEVIVVGPESFENTNIAGDKSNAKFILVPDTSMQIQKDYDVLFSVTKKYQGKIKTFLRTDIAKNNNQQEAALPVPATYIINKEGKIIWRFFDYDYSKRSSVREVVDNL